MSDYFIREPETLRIAGNPSRQTLYNWERDGNFPKRRKIGPNSVAWLKSEIDQWIADRATGRSMNPANYLLLPPRRDDATSQTTEI